MGLQKAVHHRTLHLGQVQADAARGKFVVQGFQCFQRGIVDGVDGGTHQDHVAQGRGLGDAVQDHRLQKPGVGEI